MVFLGGEFSTSRSCCRAELMTACSSPSCRAVAAECRAYCSASARWRRVVHDGHQPRSRCQLPFLLAAQLFAGALAPLLPSCSSRCEGHRPLHAAGAPPVCPPPSAARSPHQKRLPWSSSCRFPLPPASLRHRPPARFRRVVLLFFEDAYEQLDALIVFYQALGAERLIPACLALAERLDRRVEKKRHLAATSERWRCSSPTCTFRPCRGGSQQRWR